MTQTRRFFLLLSLWFMSFWRMHCKYLLDFLSEMAFHIIISPMIFHIYKNSMYILSEIWNWSIEYTLVLKQMLLQYAKQYIHICNTSLRCILFAVEYDGIFVLWYVEKPEIDLWTLFDFLKACFRLTRDFKKWDSAISWLPFFTSSTWRYDFTIALFFRVFKLYITVWLFIPFIAQFLYM